MHSLSLSFVPGCSLEPPPACPLDAAHSAPARSYRDRARAPFRNCAGSSTARSTAGTARRRRSFLGQGSYSTQGVLHAIGSFSAGQLRRCIAPVPRASPLLLRLPLSPSHHQAPSRLLRPSRRKFFLPAQPKRALTRRHSPSLLVLPLSPPALSYPFLPPRKSSPLPHHHLLAFTRSSPPANPSNRRTMLRTLLATTALLSVVSGQAIVNSPAALIQCRTSSPLHERPARKLRRGSEGVQLLISGCRAGCDHV